MRQTEVESVLRAASLRVTGPRVAVLEVVGEQPHSDASTVLQGVLQRLGAVSARAVYDDPEALTGAGLLRRIEPEGSHARLERLVGEIDRHVVCRNCGVIADVECATGVAPCLDGSDDHGFV